MTRGQLGGGERCCGGAAGGDHGDRAADQLGASAGNGSTGGGNC